ncbi:MAG: F(420)H(2) dehydrogenase subunit I [Methanomassiliicoccales archaeon PtaU1.Bin124]|nr:MAG: F(420)H(2) dehydrogenase subunit I [Methanomassiliicoccales archaeon PtaU1.Bin124]
MLSTVFRNLVSKPDTVKYPYAAADIPSGNRGRVEWNMDACILCGLCEKRCPTLAVKVDKRSGEITVQVPRCIACGVCIDVCSKDAITMTPEYSKPCYGKEVRSYQKEMKTVSE